MTRVAINGFGRIGRLAGRIISGRKDLELVAINDLTDTRTNAHLFKYDSNFGRFPGRVTADENALVINGRTVKVLKERDPAKLPWKELEVELVLESTGFFRTREGCQKHLEAGAKRVLLSAPAKDEVDMTVVMGVNHTQIKDAHQIISNASCTTNCLGPVTKLLHDQFGIEYGFMTTVHAITNDQRTADQVHSDLRRSRAASGNIIPTSTGAARAIGLVIPELAGKLDGIAMRVPVLTGSVIDLVIRTSKPVSRDGVNALMKSAAEGEFKGILDFTEEPIVSSDIVADPHSSIFDGLSTMVMEERLLKVVSWYDNEWGYSNRCADMLEFLGGRA